MGRVIVMKYLLDTHIWLWSLLEPEKLNQAMREVLENSANECRVVVNENSLMRR